MKVGVVGAGMVGSASAYAMVLRGACRDIVLVDLNAARAQAEAQDIAHATSFAYATPVRAGGYADLADASVVVLACGVGQRPGESRLDLLARNAAVFREVIGRVLEVTPKPVLLVATNPVDVMTQVAAHIAGLPAGRVIGTGTLLDSARFRSLLGDHLGVSPKSVHAAVLGEHGDSEVLAWSAARVGGLSLERAAQDLHKSIGEDERQCIDEGVRRAAYRIIDGKGATWYGIGAGVARIVQAIQRDERATFTLSVPSEPPDGGSTVAFSLPRVLGIDGICATFVPELNAQESRALDASVAVLRSAWDEVAGAL